MAKGNNQKLKLLRLAQIFMEETDEEHSIDLPEVIRHLQSYDIAADRKTLYQDFEELRKFGLDIIGEQQGRNYTYRLASREFELPELKLLVDAVQSSKFVTDRKSRELIRKLETLASRYEAEKLNRQVFIPGRIKTMNESIYYNVDKLHEAIGADRQISFQYFQWNLHKEMELRHGGVLYHVSPWALLWDNENYYLVGFDEQDRKIKHYRVDKMLKISVTEDRRHGQEEFDSFDLPKYTRSLFGMYGGEEVRVTLEVENTLAGVIIDRFGKDVPIIPTDQAHFKTMISAAVSPQFFGWIMSFGGSIRILSPEPVVRKFLAAVEEIRKSYS